MLVVIRIMILLAFAELLKCFGFQELETNSMWKRKIKSVGKFGSIICQMALFDKIMMLMRMKVMFL